MSDQAEQQSSTAFDTVKWLLVAVLVAVVVWGNSFYADMSPLYRALGALGLALVAAAIALQTSQGQAFNQLRKDAAVELRKVVWPTRQEALQTTLVVLVFVVIVSMVLFGIDWVVNGLVSWVIG